MMNHYKWSITELDNMMPWEREIYVDNVKQFVEEERKIKEKRGSINDQNSNSRPRGRSKRYKW